MAPLNFAPFSLLLVCYCCLVAFALSEDVAGSRSIVRFPQNNAVEQGSVVTLECESSDDGNVRWVEYTTDSQGALISDGTFLLPGHPNYARYKIDHPEDTNIYNLIIDKTVMSDGGTYTCYDSDDSVEATNAELIMLDARPNCTTNVPVTGYVVEGTYYTIECMVGYRGNVAPVFTWTGPDPDETGPWSTGSSTTPTSVWTGLSVNMTRYFNAKKFEVRVNFTEEDFADLSNSATNVPTWNYSASTVDLYVQWAPKAYVVPWKPFYMVGETLECLANSNPESTYYWRNVDTLEQTNGSRLVLTDSLVGSQTMQCHAENVIGGVQYPSELFFNLTVNAITSPPPSTTPAMSTTPAAESECDDLTGRWTATSPNLATICIQIDNSLGGRMVGLFRNASDPYFIEIRGRVTPFQYDQIGFTGIWPLDIGTLSFNAICKKCMGTELLQTTGIARKVTDNPSCQNPGPIYEFANYEFQRTGPPCQALFQEMNVKF